MSVPDIRDRVSKNKTLFFPNRVNFRIKSIGPIDTAKANNTIPQKDQSSKRYWQKSTLPTYK